MEYTDDKTKNFATLSLVSVVITGIVIAIHHLLEIGIEPFIGLLILLVFLPVVLMWYYQKKKNKYVYYIYIIIDLWILIGFGIFHGFFVHTVKILGFYLIEPLAELHGGRIFTQTGSINSVLDFSGFLIFLMSLVSAYYLNKFIQGEKSDE